LVVVVTGMPGTGKTTIAEALSRDLGLPLVSRDRIKERLYDTLGIGDVEWSDRLGGAAFALLFDSARVMLESGHAVMLEANFFRGTEQEFVALPPHRAIQIHCKAPLDVLIARYADRPRHRGHHDAEKLKVLPARFQSGAHEPLDLPGDLITVDTSHRVDLHALVEWIRPHL
jgi:predicted kinase